MSEATTELGQVGDIIQGLLPRVNEGFNWDLIRQQYDKHPEGTAMSLHFTDDTGRDAIEDIYMAIDEGPEIVILEGLDDSWDYIGAIIMYQDYGLRVLDPDDPMTPDRARFAHRGITIEAPEGESAERTWIVVKNVLDVMLESLVYQRDAPEAGGD